MRTKLTLATGLIVGFFLGSKAGHKPYEFLLGIGRRLRGTRMVSRPIEATATQVSGFVRSRGEEMTNRAASGVYNKIVGIGQGPIVVEARVSDAQIPAMSDQPRD